MSWAAGWAWAQASEGSTHQGQQRPGQPSPAASPMERRPSERPRQGQQMQPRQGHQEEGRGARGTRDTGNHHVPYSGSGEVHQSSGGTQGPLAQEHSPQPSSGHRQWGGPGRWPWTQGAQPWAGDPWAACETDPWWPFCSDLDQAWLRQGSWRARGKGGTAPGVVEPKWQVHNARAKMPMDVVLDTPREKDRTKHHD